MNRRRIKKAFKRLSYLPQHNHLFLYLSNKIKHVYLKLIRSTKVAYPSTLMLELTNQCNLACTICPREHFYGKEMDKGKMDIDTAKKVIDQAYPYLDSIGLTGLGETFMFKKIEEIVDYIKNKHRGIIISVSTNAVLPNFIEKVKCIIGKIDTIQISIDGLDEVYNKIRIKSDFKVLDYNIRALVGLCKNTKTELMLNMVVTKENYIHIPNLIYYAEEVGIEYMDFTIFNLAAVTEHEVDYYKFYESDSFFKVVKLMDEAILKSKNVTVTNRQFKTDNGFKNCRFPWSHFYVSQDANIPPCCAKPFPKEKNFGSVEKNKLIDILNSRSFREWRELWFKNETPEFCKKCHLVHLKPLKNKTH